MKVDVAVLIVVAISQNELRKMQENGVFHY